MKQLYFLLMDIFWEVHRDLPREGPGDNASTRRAFQCLPAMPARPFILDMGCGPGMQTLELARLSGGRLVGLDTHLPFLIHLHREAQAVGLAAQIDILNASMANAPFAEQSFDLIWSEGAIYILGFAAGLSLWRRLLRPGGCVAVTELSWLKQDPPQEPLSFWRSNYPAMQSVETNCQMASKAGYHLLEHFTLPDSAWWESYYGPMHQRITALRAKYADRPENLAGLDGEQAEIDLFQQYSNWYGYEFYLLRA